MAASQPDSQTDGAASLAGRGAVVTGGAQGMGLGIARALLEAGASVTIAARGAERLERAVAELEGRGAILGVRADVGRRADVEALLDSASEAHGPTSVLVCSHGVIGDHPFLEMTDEQWDSVLRTNLTGCFIAGQVAARQMVAAGVENGRIVLIGSIGGLRADRNSADYSASKAAVHVLARGMAIDLSEHGITVNVVVPGFIRTPMSEPYAAGLTDEETGRFVLNPVGRMGEPSDIANAVRWLCDPATSFVTGQTVTVDGGETAVLHQSFL